MTFGIIVGIIAGITWAFETIFIGQAQGMDPLAGMAMVVLIATFIHDACSAIFSWIYNSVRGNLGGFFKALRTKSGKWVIAAAVIGGPIGMTGYVMTVNYLGASIGSVASAIFPAIGSVLAYFFLKEKMKWYQWIFLLATIGGVYGLFYSSEIAITNIWLGILGAVMCSFGWGIEAVILAKCLTDPEVTDELALQIRQTTSAIVFGAIILPIVGAWGDTVTLFSASSGWTLPFIVIAALFATVSYLFYYKAISKIGASKAMALNVSYAAWAMIIGLFLPGATIPGPMTFVFAAVVLICSILAAADFKDIFKKGE